jgi:hypothetical protein
VLALARAERRVIVTNNVRDFRPLHVESVMPGGLPGLRAPARLHAA